MNEDERRGRVQTKVVDETGREPWVCPTESRGDESGWESWVSPDKSRGRVQTKVVDETGREPWVCLTESRNLLRSREASDLAADNRN